MLAINKRWLVCVDHEEEIIFFSISFLFNNFLYDFFSVSCFFYKLILHNFQLLFSLVFSSSSCLKVKVFLVFMCLSWSRRLYFYFVSFQVIFSMLLNESSLSSCFSRLRSWWWILSSRLLSVRFIRVCQLEKLYSLDEFPLSPKRFTFHAFGIDKKYLDKCIEAREITMATGDVLVHNQSRPRRSSRRLLLFSWTL